MKPIGRKDFIRHTASIAGGAIVAPAYVRNMISKSPNEKINIAILGISGQRKNVRGMINGIGMCSGGKLVRDDDQEVPNTMIASYEYEDGMIVQNEVRSLYTNPEGLADSGDCFLYSDKGWMTFNDSGYKTYFGPKNEPGPAKSEKDIPEEERRNGWENLIDCVRSRKREDLDNEILEGHLSAALGHLGVISYRTGRKLTFNPETEKFINDPDADKLLTREYRKPYTMPEKI